MRYCAAECHLLQTENSLSAQPRPERLSFRAVLLCVILVFLLGTLQGCSRSHELESGSSNGSIQVIPADESVLAEGLGPIFRDVTEASGVDFVQFNGATGDLHFPEILGGGSALFDADQDGDLDLYLVQGQVWEGDSVDDSFFPARDPELRDRFYRNDLELHDDGSRTQRWVDVTDESQIDAQGYGTGVAVGDFDGDGWLDLYLTAFGANQLWRNLGSEEDGFPRFEDVTEETGTDDSRWSTSATWADFDRNGRPDLYVANYVNFRLSNSKVCRQATGHPDYCGPLSFSPERDRLFVNTGEGFEDHTGYSGVAKPGSGLGVMAADLDDDGWIDLYVANDQMANFFWRNEGPEGDLRFVDEASFSGTAVSFEGKPEASMGVDRGDLDNDGDLDLFVTHLDGETNTLYVNEGGGLFRDRSNGSHLGAPSVPMTGFGTVLFDFDNDGWLDVLTVNGAVKVIEEQAAAGSLFPFAQRNQLFRNRGVIENGQVSFDEVPMAIAGGAFERSEVSRGVAVGDIDNDGDQDVLITNAAGPARLLINDVGQSNHWLGLEPHSGNPPQIQVGSKVFVKLPGGVTVHRRVRRDGSFLSSHDPRILVGLGSSNRVESVTVEWTDGSREEWGSLEIDRYHLLIRGEGNLKTGEEGTLNHVKGSD